MKKQTAVQWLIEQKRKFHAIINDDLEKALAMEKEQIIKAVDVGFEEGSKFPEDIKLNDAEQYYKETFTEK
jgi:hypothetical protein